MFIHFGHAAHRGWELSWQMTAGVEGQYPAREPVPCEEYFANAAEFDPRAFDAAAWASAIAESGAGYAVFTTKHHDGFAMFDTALSDYSIVRTSPFGRDITAELASALRDVGVRVGFYLSLPDWHHPDYPRMTDATTTKPYRLGSYVRTSPEQWARYREFFLGQVTELLTRYGEIDLLWFDGEFEHTAEEWDFGGIREHVRSIQPNCLVNDRCVGFGDFATPEQQAPEVIPSMPWEICMTMTDSWGWTLDDDRWKSSTLIISRIAETVSAGGNMLLNVGPQGDGRFPEQALERLRDVGEWVRKHADAVRGIIDRPDGVRASIPLGRKADGEVEHIYAYATMRPWDTLTISNIPVNRITSVTVLGTGEAVPYVAIASLPEVHSGKPDPRGDLEISIPRDVADSVVPVFDIALSAR